MEVKIHKFQTSALDGSEWTASSCSFISMEIVFYPNWRLVDSRADLPESNTEPSSR
jgi:hypothetical protein